jgi:hypothetical protein
LTGALLLAGLLLSRLLYAPLRESVFEPVFRAMAGADLVFANGEAFYSHWVRQAALLGLTLLAGGLAFALLRRRARWGKLSLLALLVADLSLAVAGFNLSRPRSLGCARKRPPIGASLA